MFISSFVGASEQNTAGCKQAADDALKLFAANEKIKNLVAINLMPADNPARVLLAAFLAA